MEEQKISCLLRCYSETKSLIHIAEGLGLTPEDGASIRDLNSGDEYSYTSVVVINSIHDVLEFSQRIQEWLDRNVELICKIDCERKWLEVSLNLSPNLAYDGFSLPAAVIAKIAQSGCSLSVTCYNALPVDASGRAREVKP